MDMRQPADRRQVRDGHTATGDDLLALLRAYDAPLPAADLGPRARIVSREYKTAQLKDNFSRSAAWRKE